MTTRGRRPAQDKEDPWELDSGLPNDCDVTITKSVFGYQDNYMNGEAALLIWDVESPDADFQYPIIWSCGAGWDVKERGKSVEHEKRSRFVETSGVGRLIKRCKELGAEDVLRGRGNPREAAIWEGLTFHLKQETIPQGPGLDAWEHLMPVEFVSDEAKPAPKAAAPARTPARAAAPARVPAASRAKAAESKPEPEPETNALTERLTKLAMTLDLEKFQKAAMNIDELNDSSNGELLADILEDGQEGFWARTRAEAE